MSRLALVAVGGAAGTLARAALAEVLPTSTDTFAWATWTANMTGAFLLGALVAAVLAAAATRWWVQPLLASGLLGAFTTFATLALELHTLVDGGHVAVAIGYAAATIGGGLAAAVAGSRATRTWLRVRGEASP